MRKLKYIYLDNAGTTPMATKVIEKMTETMTNTFGNASAVNYYGRQARAILDNGRHVIAESINAKNDNESRTILFEKHRYMECSPIQEHDLVNKLFIIRTERVFQQ